MIRRILWLLILCALANRAIAQKSYFFTSITKREGLSNNSIRDIVQDSIGYIWIATSDGLNRFDGHRFKVFRNNKYDPFSIPGNSVEKIHIDSDGNLWCGGSGWNAVAMIPSDGLNFKIIPLDGVQGKLEIRDIATEPSGKVWIGTSEGFFYIEPGSSIAINTESISLSQKKPLGSNSYYGNSICSDHVNNGIWMFSNSSVNFLDFKTGEFYNRNYNPGNKSIFDMVRCRDAVVDNNGVLWTTGNLDGKVSTWFGYDLASNKFILDPSPISQYNNRTIDNFTAMNYSPSNEIWLGNNHRLPLIFRIDKYSFDSTLARVYPGCLGNQTIRTTCFDRDGNIWVGSEQGLFLASKEHMIADVNWIGNVSEFQKPRIKSLYPLDENNILLAADKSILHWNVSENKLDTITPNLKGKPIDEGSRLISRKDDNSLWLATFTGLFSYNLSTKIFEDEVEKVPESWKRILRIDSRINQVFSDSGQFNYICTSHGLFVFNHEKSYYKLFSIKNLKGNVIRVTHYSPSKDGGYWFCATGNNEVYRLPSPTDSLMKYMLPANLNIIPHCLFESDGELWIGSTNNGIAKVNLSNQSFVEYSIEDGLHSNCIYKILGDFHGNIFVVTSDGIAQFDPKNSRFKRIFSAYSLSDYTHRDVGCIGQDGNIWSFSDNIFYSIDPTRIADIKYNKVLISLVTVMNKETNSASSEYLSSLTYSQNTISFDFTSLSFNPEVKIRYEYQLSGIT